MVTTAGRRSILVIAEDPAIVGPTGLVFRALGYEIRVVSNALDALKSLVADPPNVVLCDAGLEGSDVSQLTREIRSVESGDQIVMILSGYGAEPVGNAADGFVLRPFDPIKVVDIIEAATAGGRSTSAEAQQS